jgi:hypothetical protein
MNTSTRIHWRSVLIGGFLAEASVFGLVIPVLMISGQHAMLYAAPVASLVVCFLFALWVGGGLNHASSCTGYWSALLLCFLYVALTRAHPEPFAHLLAHGLKILGGAGGGLVAARR